MDRTNNHTPGPGLPNAKNPKRNTHANIAMSITRLMPKRPKKNGINKMQNVSLICDMEIRILACCTPNVSAYSGMPPKEKMKGLAKTIGDLQTDAQTHGKDEKQSHTLLTEQREGTKP